MRTINVVSNFAANNPPFSTPGEAIEYSRSRRDRGGLVIPDSDVLAVEGYRFDPGFASLEIGFANGNELAFGTGAEALTVGYGPRPGVGTGARPGGIRGGAVRLNFTGKGNACVWEPAAALDALVGKEVLGFYKFRNQLYLYLDGFCLYVRTLTDADTGALLLYWTLSD